MAKLIPFGATKIAHDVKELIEIYVENEDWDMNYSNSAHGFVFKRSMNWNTEVRVEGGNREGEIVVTIESYGKSSTPFTYRGDKAVEEAAKHIMDATRG